MRRWCRVEMTRRAREFTIEDQAEDKTIETEDTGLRIPMRILL